MAFNVSTEGFCDFCNQANPSWRYLAQPMIHHGMGIRMDEGWAACDTCHEMIESGDYDGLLVRSLNGHSFFKKANGLVLLIAQEQTRKLHQAFRSNRVGEAVHY